MSKVERTLRSIAGINKQKSKEAGLHGLPENQLSRIFIEAKYTGVLTLPSGGVYDFKYNRRRANPTDAKPRINFEVLMAKLDPIPLAVAAKLDSLEDIEFDWQYPPLPSYDYDAVIQIGLVDPTPPDVERAFEWSRQYDNFVSLKSIESLVPRALYQRYREFPTTELRWQGVYMSELFPTHNFASQDELLAKIPACIEAYNSLAICGVSSSLLHFP